MLEPINVKYFKYAVGSNLGKETPTDISAKCILCGDSKNGKKKRLHLFTKQAIDGDIIHCFNCEFTGNMFTFLKQGAPHLYDQYKREKLETSFNRLKNEKKKEFKDSEIWIPGSNVPNLNNSNSADSTDSTDSSSDRITVNKVKQIENKELPKFVFKMPNEFIPCINSKGADYISGRKLNPEDYYFCREWITLHGKKMPLKNCIIIPLWFKKEENLIYGFQARSTETKFFYNYIPEENTGFKIWNWFNISKEKAILVFESVFDARSSGMSEDQIIASLGIDISNDRSNEVKKLIYCLDNQRVDYASKKKTKELLKKGEYVFIWPKGIKEKDFNKMLENGYTKDEIKKLIKNNIKSGLSGIVSLL